MENGDSTVVPGRLSNIYIPNADVRVIQMIVDYTQPLSYHFDMANRLQSLRKKGVLFIGTGNIVHNTGLDYFQNMHKDNYGFDWAIEASAKTNQWIMDENFSAFSIFKTIQGYSIGHSCTRTFFASYLYSWPQRKQEGN